MSFSAMNGSHISTSESKKSLKVETKRHIEQRQRFKDVHGKAPVPLSFGEAPLAPSVFDDMALAAASLAGCPAAIILCASLI